MVRVFKQVGHSKDVDEKKVKNKVPMKYPIR